jgi:ABC-type transport system involved in cytochrome bd biosynthesis fused ATPase/permease subunit
LPAAAQAGLIAAVLMFVPFAGFGLGMGAAGILAVLFYRRRTVILEITPGMGARLGALSGTLGFGIFAIFTAIELLVFHSGGELRAAMLEAIQQSAARSADPQAQQLLEYLKSPAGLALMMGVGLAVMLVIFLIFSSLGGALGAVLLRRKSRM